LEVRDQFTVQLQVILERIFFGVVFYEEVEGVDDDHIGDDFDLDAEFLCFFGEYDSGLVVAKRVLLPVDEMVFGGDFEGISLDRGTGMDGRPQAEDMGG
jgi:hypothetical protein